MALKLLQRRVFTNRGPAYVGKTTLSGGIGLSGASSEAQLKTYENVGIVFQIVSRHAEAAAESTWNLYRIGSDDPVPDHPAAQLWRTPNPFMDQNEFIERAVQHYDLVGECDWFVARSTAARVSMPLELWPVLPTRLEPLPSPANYLDGWAYTPPGGKTQPWKVDEVIQMARPDPNNPYRGRAPIAAAMADVYGERAAAAYNNAFFVNGADPGGIIKFPERLSDEQFDEFVERWRQQHQGTANAHKIGVLEGADYIERKSSLRDMQFEELRKLNRDFIRQAFGYPKSMLGDTEDVNKASAIAGEYVFVRWIIRPTLARIQATLNTKLLPMFGSSAQGLEFRFTTPVPADKELEIAELDSQANRAKTLIEAGFSADDVAKYVGLPAMAFEKPAAPAPAPEEPQTRTGRRSTADDPEARALWEEGEALRAKHPRLSIEVIAGRLGISERTYRRYQSVFASSD